MIVVRLCAAGAAPALLFALAGCDGNPFMPKADEGHRQPGVSVSAASGGAASRAAAPEARESSVPAPPSAAPETSPLPQSAPDYAALQQVKDPARVLAFLAVALHDGRWADAARAWGERGTASMLQQRFGAHGAVTLSFGDGESEGAAGSLYYSAPYTLRRADGAQEKGTVVLRRVNDVPGASQASLHWHVESMGAGG